MHTIIEIDTIVSQLDPLGVDDFFKERFQRLNEKGNLEELIHYCSEFITIYKQIDHLDLYTSLAITRDLGFIASSITRHGGNIAQVEGLEKTLLNLSEITLEVPRDNVNSYATRNPKGERLRTYTRFNEEIIFIENVRKSMDKLHKCVECLLVVKETEPTSENYSQMIQNAVGFFEVMIESVVDTKRKLPPLFFTNELRPYFPPLTIGGTTYYGPGGAQMSMIVVDYLLYGSSLSEKRYVNYLEDTVKYMPSEYRNIIIQYEGQPSIIDVFVNKISETSDHTMIIESLRAINKIMKRIMIFRTPHRQMANENMLVRPPKSVGSGGYDTSILDYLCDLTSGVMNEVNKLSGKYTKLVGDSQ